MLSTAWTAGATRARLLLERRIGAQQARAIAAEGSLADALGMLAGSAYGERAGTRAVLAVAQRRVAETLLWHLRIAAGWLPAAGAALVRELAARFEIENVDARLAALAGDGREAEPFELGGLAIAWPRVDRARTLEEVASVLRGSAWRLPPVAGTAPELALALRVAWARRVWEAVPEAASWVAGAGGILIARELILSERAAHLRLMQSLPGVGARWGEAGTLAELRRALPGRAAWPLAGAEEPGELWRAEDSWWRRVERDAERMRRARRSREAVLAAVALLALDAERARRALASAALALDPGEALDAAA